MRSHQADGDMSAGARARSQLTHFLFARFHAQEGKASVVEQALRDVFAPTRAEPGCLKIQAYRSVRDTAEFYIHSHWVDAAAFEHHGTLAHTRQFAERMECLIDHPLKVTLAREIGC
jgi:quinol monooxygenase YgiN